MARCYVVVLEGLFGTASLDVKGMRLCSWCDKTKSVISVAQIPAQQKKAIHFPVGKATQPLRHRSWRHFKPSQRVQMCPSTF
eukprot:2601721-Prorocentrum_lima.AAC.1